MLCLCRGWVWPLGCLSPGWLSLSGRSNTGCSPRLAALWGRTPTRSVSPRIPIPASSLTLHPWKWLLAPVCFIILYTHQFSSVQFSSVAQLCPTLCDPMDCSTPGLPVHHQLLELTQTHVTSHKEALLLLLFLRLFETLWTVARQAPLSMGIPQAKY